MVTLKLLWVLHKQADKPLKNINKVFYDTCEENELKLQKQLELSKTQKHK